MEQNSVCGVQMLSSELLSHGGIQKMNEDDEIRACESEEDKHSSNEREEDHASDQIMAMRGRMDVISKELVQALDAAKVSNYQAAVILSAAAKAMGIDVTRTNINVTTIRRKRVILRSELAAEVKDSFQADRVLTVHWDGKIVETLTGKQHIDRQAIVVTGIETNQLLGAPAMTLGTGRAIAEIVVQHVTDWNIAAKVKALCFDTTAVNSGWKNGAATWIERILHKNLLWLPCRHHVLELILESVHTTIMGKSTGPEIKLFKSFQQNWADIDQANYKAPRSFPSILGASRRAYLIQFAEKHINACQPRDDYLELLELVTIFLGGTLSRGARFRSPGPMHHARWMCKAIYAFKVWLFKEQTKVSSSEADGLFDLCCFIASTYLESWYSAPRVASAPREDFLLVRRLHEFSTVSQIASDVALKKMSNHFWYISEEMIALAIFDDDLPQLERQELANSILNRIGDDEPGKKRIISPQDLLKLNVSDLGTTNSSIMFEILEIETDFLEQPVSSWSVNENYKRGKVLIDNLRVVNDHAERGVKLMQDYNRIITRKETQYQELLLCVDNHRKSLPNVNKNTLNNKYKL